MGDDPERRPGPPQSADRRNPGEAVAGARDAWDELDDRDVEVADRIDQVESRPTVGGLLDVITLGEQPPDPQPDGGLLIDDQAATLVCSAYAPVRGEAPVDASAEWHFNRQAAQRGRLEPS